MSKYQDDWKDRVNVREVINELGIVVKKDVGTWARCLCPFHDDTHESFSIALEPVTTGAGHSSPGHWTCYACGSGNIATLVARVRGINTAQAIKDLIAQYAPDFAVATPAQVRKAIPTQVQVEAWHTHLLEDEVAMDYLTERGVDPCRSDITETPPRCLSDEVVRNARLGIESGRIKLPIFAKDGQTLLNVRTHVWLKSHFSKGEPKIKGVFKGGIQAFPLHMVNWDKPIVICEGEFDALALHSIGQNALTLTGGVKSYTWENWKQYLKAGDDQEVIVCLDQDSAGKKASRLFRKELIAAGMGKVRVVSWLPDECKDITDVFRKTEQDDWAKVWGDIIKKASVLTASSCDSCGLVAENGSLVEMLTAEETAPFIGEVVLTGRERFGIAGETCRIFHLELVHKTGKKIEVIHRYGDPFNKSVAQAPGAGPEWAFSAKEADRVFVWLCQSSKNTQGYDTGWIYGFDAAAKEGTEFDRYYTKSTIFTKAGPIENDEILMRAPSPVLRQFDLPIVDKAMAREGLRVLLQSVYRSHVPQYMGPLIASALLAPIRRILFPDEPRYCVMIYGQSGCGKTSRAHVVQNLFGSFPTYSHIMSWESTQRSVSQVAAHAGDSFILVDEFPVAMMRKKERDEAVRLLLGMAQGMGRTRLDSAGRILQNEASNSIMAITSEALPMDNEAQLARALCLFVPTEELLNQHWDKPFQDSKGGMLFLPHAMGAWIDWILGGYSSLCWEETAGAKAIVTKAADAHNPGWRGRPNNLRVLNRVSCISRVWMLFMEFMIQEGLLAPDDQQDLHEEWFNTVVPSVMGSSMTVLSSSGVEEVFLDQIVTALTSGKAKLILDGPGDEKETIPTYASHNAPVIGYYRQAPSSQDSYILNGVPIEACLMPGALAATESLQEIGGKWQTLTPYLTGSGLARKRDERGGQARVQRRRVLWLTRRGAQRLLEPLDRTAM